VPSFEEDESLMEITEKEDISSASNVGSTMPIGLVAQIMPTPILK
jgi:hypothetical protein